MHDLPNLGPAVMAEDGSGHLRGLMNFHVMSRVKRI
jgi:hypothetical protein